MDNIFDQGGNGWIPDVGQPPPGTPVGEGGTVDPDDLADIIASNDPELDDAIQDVVLEDPGFRIAVNVAVGSACVLDYMSTAQRDQVLAGTLTDCTAAFDAAQQASRHVIVPAGRYGLNNFRTRNGLHLDCASPPAVRFDQLVANQPAIRCQSDATYGHLEDVNLHDFVVYGHASASVAAATVEAYGAYGLRRSKFRYRAMNTFRGLEVQGPDAANVYLCQFDVLVQGCTGTGVLVVGGAYNRFDMFIVQTSTWALDDQSSYSEINVIAENCMIFRGQNNFIQAKVENIIGPPGSNVAIGDLGYGNTYIEPAVILSVPVAGLDYAFRPFGNTVYINPQVISLNSAIPHPFAADFSTERFTVIGGRNSAVNKIEATYADTWEVSSMRRPMFVGAGAEQFCSKPADGMRVQRETPTTGATVTIKSGTDVLRLTPAGTIAALTVAFLASPLPFEGWRLRFFTTQTITAITWPGGAAHAELPTTLAANTGFEMVWNNTGAKWERC